jgi:hypothetical protein
VGERPDDDTLDPALEVLGDILDGFAAAEDHVGRRFNHVAAQFMYRYDERDSRAERRFLEQQRNVLALERPASASARGTLFLHRCRKVEQLLEPGVR